MKFLLLKKASGDGNRDNIIESVGSGGDSEAANREKKGEINPGDGAESEPCPVEGIDGVQPAGEEIYVMMRAEKRRRDENRQHDGILMVQPE